MHLSASAIVVASRTHGETAAIAWVMTVVFGLVAGYVARRPLSDAESRALPVLARGAAMRFLATRAYDWLNTPADALVTRKNPMDFARRLEFYVRAGEGAFPGAPA